MCVCNRLSVCFSMNVIVVPFLYLQYNVTPPRIPTAMIQDLKPLNTTESYGELNYLTRRPTRFSAFEEDRMELEAFANYKPDQISLPPYKKNADYE